MGACNFGCTAFGKTVQEAYEAACDVANAYSGHQEGYSGDIQTTSGYIVIERNGRNISTIENLYLDNERSPVQKRGRCGAIVLKGKDAKKYREGHRLVGKYGVVVYFFGWGAC